MVYHTLDYQCQYSAILVLASTLLPQDRPLPHPPRPRLQYRRSSRHSYLAAGASFRQHHTPAHRATQPFRVRSAIGGETGNRHCACSKGPRICRRGETSCYTRRAYRGGGQAGARRNTHDVSPLRCATRGLTDLAMCPPTFLAPSGSRRSALQSLSRKSAHVPSLSGFATEPLASRRCRARPSGHVRSQLPRVPT